MIANDLKLQHLVDTVKMLLYQQDDKLLQKLNFEDDTPFLEPLLFAYFNSNKHKECLNEILQGYFVKPEPLKTKQLYNSENIAYLPNLGYYNEQQEKIGEIEYLAASKIELLKHKSPMLDTVFRDSKETQIEGNLIEISENLIEKYKLSLNNAIEYIKQSSPAHFELIETCCKKIVLFKTNPNNTNSFATQRAQGIAFLNAYQEAYDEVFFVDDIAHQTGHVIMFTFWFQKQEHFIIDPNTQLAPVLQNPKEYRSFYVLFHALYTYYTTVLCMDNCMERNLFNKRQEEEAIARIGFYLKKYQYDLICFEKFCTNFSGIENVVKEPSIKLYNFIKEKYIETVKKI